jgi:HlyD family secretion protein
MNMHDDLQFNENDERLWSQRSYEKYGLQGAATVLELRQLQEAFDQEFRKPQTRPVTRTISHIGERSAAGKKRKHRDKAESKSVMGKMVSACLHGLGLATTHPAAIKDTRTEGQRFKGPTRKPGPHTDMRGSHRAYRAAAPNARTPLDDLARQPALKELERELALMLSESALTPTRRPVIGDAPGRQVEVRRSTIQAAAPMLPVTRGEDQAQGVSSKLFNQVVTNGVQQARRGYGFLVNYQEDSLEENAPLQRRVARSLEKELRTGLRVLLAGIVTFGGWATLVPLASAIAVPGSLVAETSVKKVQHSTGGVVAKILARDGMHVKEGDTLLRLDETQTRTNRQVIAAQLNQVRVRIARLIAERDEAREPIFPDDLSSQPEDKDVGQLLASERSFFRARATSRQNQKEVLQTRIVQLEREISGLTGQLKSRITQIDLVREELKGLQGLFERHLVPVTRLTTLQREAARLEGEQAQMSSAISEAQSKIGEAKLQIEQIDQGFRSEVLKDLREAQDKEAELAERSIAAKDQLDRIEIRAPASGVVHQLSVHTLGGVISPAEVIMEIVPDTDELQVEARLPPNEIDHVQTGQKGMVRFSAFNQRTTPQLEGLVSYVSADLAHDRQTNAAFYTVRVTLPGDQRRRLGGLQLVAGMPAEVFLQTGTRTMMSYLLKPISDQLERTFNEP